MPSSLRGYGRLFALSHSAAGVWNGLHGSGFVLMEASTELPSVFCHARVISPSVMAISNPWRPGWPGRLKCIFPKTAVLYPSLFSCFAIVGLSSASGVLRTVTPAAWGS